MRVQLRWRRRRQRLLDLTVGAAVTCGFLVAMPAAAQQAAQQIAPAPVVATPVLTLERIMAHPDWLGNEPQDPYWADDSRAIYFSQKRQRSEELDLFRLDLATGQQQQIADEERATIDVAGGEWSLDRRYKVYARDGDIFVKAVGSGEARQLTRTAALESEPFFLLGEPKRVAYYRENGVFTRHLDDGLEAQIGDLRLSEEPAAEEEPDSYLEHQQLRLFDYLREEKERRQEAEQTSETRQQRDPTRPPLPFFLGDDIEIRQMALSPSGRHLLLVVVDAERPDEGRQDRMPRWVTDSGYVEVEDVRRKVGDGEASERLLWLDLESHATWPVDLAGLPGLADDPLADLRRQARERQAAESPDEDATEDTEQPADDSGSDSPRPVAFEERVAWSPDGRHVAIQAHSLDNKDRWIALLSATAEGPPELLPIHRLSDPRGWINWSFNESGWIPGQQRLWFLSEESGWSQLYLYTVADGSTRRLTHGDHIVEDPIVGPFGRFLYYTANPDHPGRYEIYRVALDSGDSEQLTRLGGRNSAWPSPDGKKLAVLHSTTINPPELYLQNIASGDEARRLTRTISREYADLPWVAPQIVAVPSSHHDRSIYSRLYLPRKSDDGDLRPAVIFVHGAGYLQNAHEGWSGYFREHMFHNLLIERGYVVLDMDYRASRGYGRDWRTAIYRQMGTPELEDLGDGVEYLIANHGVDRRRVGVYGGSYGGFMALMALFKQPDLFACGAALRPVTDWAHYNHPYTSNILNTPAIDPEAYERSSPIEFADGLERPLLICAPMLDDNVFFQDTVRLAQRLIELEKENWEVAIYPIEPHGFRQPSSWLDEYRRIFKLFETHLAP